MRRGVVVAASAFALALMSMTGVAAAAQTRVTVRGTAAPGLGSSSQIGTLAPSAPLSFAVTLPLRNRPALDSLIDAVSDPNSPQYGHYLTPAEFNSRFTPTDAQVQNVTSYLRSQGITVSDVSANNTVIDAQGQASDVQRAFDTTIARFHDPRLNRDYHANTSALSLPQTVAPDVLGVVGLSNHFPHVHPPLEAAQPLVGAGPAGGYTPSQLKTAYDVNPLASAGFTGSGQHVGLFELATYKQSNITSYDNQYGLGSPAPTIVSVDGGNTTLGNAEVEVELDIEVVQAIAPAAQITVFEGPNSDQGVIDTYNKMATSNTTPANSTSWGLCEPDSSTATINSESQVFAQMAAQGQGLFAASGDSAAYDCGTSGQLAVDNPADDPNVTGTGGTRLTLNTSNGYSSEVPWDTNATEGGGGGVSTIFAKPSWQTSTPSACTKRCVPDISSDADPATGYSIFTQGSWTVVGGTSAAAPMWAGFTAVYNQDATANGKTRLGYANPSLYNLAHTTQSFTPFHDITTGHTSTSTNWPALTGYDMATGLGTYDANNIARDLIGGGTPPPPNDFSISASPTTLSVAQGASGNATISTAVTSGAAQTVSLSASGLPSGAGASFTPTSVTASGSSALTITTASTTPAGSYTVTITGTGTSATHSTTVTLTVTSTGGTPVQVIGNPGFETGSASPWSLTAGVLNNSSAEPPHSGSWDAWLDGYGTTHTDSAAQTVTIPAGKTSATLQFYLHIDTSETTTSVAYDKLTVTVGGTTLATYSNLNKASGYVVHSFNVSQFIGQTVTVKFTGTEDVSLQTSFVLDDVTLTAG
jgi:kumamolisin